jgi:hypothetical protein
VTNGSVVASPCHRHPPVRTPDGIRDIHTAGQCWSTRGIAACHRVHWALPALLTRESEAVAGASSFPQTRMKQKNYREDLEPANQHQVGEDQMSLPGNGAEVFRGSKLRQCGTHIADRRGGGAGSGG